MPEKGKVKGGNNVMWYRKKHIFYKERQVQKEQPKVLFQSIPHLSFITTNSLVLIWVDEGLFLC